MTTTDEPTRSKPRRRHRATVAAAIILWAVIMSPLLFWGLPTSDHDDLLFGGESAWKTERYDATSAIEQLRDDAGGADVDLNPLAGRDRIVDLTGDEAARAEILRRYRLFSRQPDEMIIFRSLQRMNPRARDFDPRLYQYGGGYIYLVGATLGAAHVVGLIELTSDAGAYLERPEAFAGFYVAARAVSMVFGGLALVAVYRLARRAGGRGAGYVAMLCAAISPVFISGVLEAKPHLPSACMLLWTTIAALDYHQKRRWRDAVLLGLCGGYAFGLVLTGIVAALLWPVLLACGAWKSGSRTWTQLSFAAVLAICVYVVTNPYVPYNLLFNPDAVTGNIGNSTAMYEGQASRFLTGGVRVGVLLEEGVGFGIILVGLVGLVVLLHTHRRATAIALSTGMGILLIAILTGAGKPAEFGRFLILPALLLCAATGCLARLLARRHWVLSLLVAILAVGAMNTPAYVHAFVNDAGGERESRLVAARYIETNVATSEPIGLLQEPAPYAVPPIDFAHRRVLLLPDTPPRDDIAGELPSWLVFTADHESIHANAWWQAYYTLHRREPPAEVALSPITWANKPVFIYRLRASQSQ